MNNLTIKSVTAELRPLGLSLRKRDGEYRVAFTVLGESSAYYTDDLSDARDTGLAMAYAATKRCADKLAAIL